VLRPSVPKTPWLGPVPPGHGWGWRRNRRVVCAFAEVVLAVLARGGEMRLGDLVGAIDAVGAGAGLLDAGEDGEGRAGTDAGDAQAAPSRQVTFC
jgi:hypothetical protein